MAITSSIGYGGFVGEDLIPTWRRSFCATYGVVAEGDWAVSLKTGVGTLTVGIAAGVGFGHGVTDTNGAEVTVTHTTLASGTRYDLIVARRNWSGAGGTTTFTKVTGTSAQLATFASRNQTPGTLDDQPLALVQVNGNGSGGAIVNIWDLRVWAANGGAVAAVNALGLDGTPLVLQYLNEAGTEVWAGSTLWHRYVDGAGALQWKQSAGYTEWIGTAVCAADGTFSGSIPAGTFSSAPSIQATVQSNTQFAFASAVATSATAFSGRCAYFPNTPGVGLGVASVTPGFTIAIRATAA